MNRLRVSLLSFSDLNSKNGIVTFLNVFRECSNQFSDHGILIDVIPFRSKRKKISMTPAACDDINRTTNQSGLISKKAQLKKIVKLWFGRYAFGSFMHFLCTLGLKGLIVAIRSRLKPRADLYFYQDFLSAFFSGLLRKRGRSVNVLILHSGDDPLKHLFIWFGAMKGTVYERLIRSVFDGVIEKQDAIVVLSKKIEDELKAVYLNKIVKAIYNTSAKPNESDVSDFPWRSGCIRFVAVGSLQYVKGFDLLLEAISMLDPVRRARMQLVIVGDGPDRRSLATLAKQLAVTESVHFVGQSDDVPMYLRSADVFIISSRDEGLPIALVEAMQFGLPVISTRVGSIPEILDEFSGIFVSADPRDISEKMKLVIDGEYDLNAMGLVSKDIFLRKLSSEAFVDNYSSFFADVVKQVSY